MKTLTLTATGRTTQDILAWLVQTHACLVGGYDSDSGQDDTGRFSYTLDTEPVNAPDTTDCDECGAAIPDTDPNVINRHHLPSCSCYDEPRFVLTQAEWGHLVIPPAEGTAAMWSRDAHAEPYRLTESEAQRLQHSWSPACDIAIVDAPPHVYGAYPSPAARHQADRDEHHARNSWSTR